MLLRDFIVITAFIILLSCIMTGFLATERLAYKSFEKTQKVLKEAVL